MLAKFESHRMVQTVQNFELFDKKKKRFFDAILQVVPVTKKVV